MTELRVMTYNMYCRPRWTFWDNQVIRAKLLAKEIEELEEKEGKKIDVLFLQEIVDNKVNKILKKELKKIGFIFKTHRTKGSWWRLNGGVVTYSRHPICEQDQYIFKLKNSYIWNAPAAKGGVYSKILVGDKHYHLVNTHLDSFKEELRTIQMCNLNKFIDSRNIPEDETIIVAGDWNIDFYKDEINNVDESFNNDGYAFEFAKLNAKASHCEFSINNDNDWIKRRITSKDDPDNKGELLDFFIYDGEDISKAEMKIVKMEHPQKAHDIIYSSPFFLNILKPWKSLKVTDVSDHYAVICDFQ